MLNVVRGSHSEYIFIGTMFVYPADPSYQTAYQMRTIRSQKLARKVIEEMDLCADYVQVNYLSLPELVLFQHWIFSVLLVSFKGSKRLL